MVQYATLLHGVIRVDTVVTAADYGAQTVTYLVT